MSKITNDGLTRSGTGCFIAVSIMATVGVKGLTRFFFFFLRSFSPSLVDKEKIISVDGRGGVQQENSDSLRQRCRRVMSVM